MGKYCIILYLMLLCLCDIRCNSPKQMEVHSHFNENCLMLISTIDGYITAVDTKTGVEKWKFKEAPVLESSIEIQHGFTFIPNPKTGQLYYLIEGRLSKLPFTIPELVRVSPCKSTDGILYAGNKKDVWISINPETGERSEAFSAPAPNSYCPVSQANHVFVGKTEYHISMIDTRAKNRRWNATFTDYTSHLLPISADVNNPYKYYTTSSDGWLVTVDAFSGNIIWKRNFNSVIVNMYLMKKDGIHKLPNTAIGLETFGTLLDESTKNWKESLIENPTQASSSYQTTLYVGQENDAGLYALSAFVDSKTPIAPTYVGPPLLEGPEFSTAKYQLARTFKEIDGEYLLLGYHQLPPLRPNNLITSSSQMPAAIALLQHLRNSERYPQLESDLFYDEFGNAHFRKCRGGRCQKLQKREPDLIISSNSRRTNPGDYDDDDLNIERFMLGILRRYPYYLLGLVSAIFTLIFTVVWLCGRQSALINASSVHQLSWPGDVSQSSSRSTNRSWFSTIMNTANGRLSLIEPAEVSEEIKIVGKLRYYRNRKLGQGAGGTIVYEGVFDDRKVAVKRVMRENFDLVQREINLLRDGGDHHGNVIRYYCSESDNDFGYIALELCEASLDDYIKSAHIRERYPTLSKLSILKQATDGIAHLHRLNFVHRDVKPRNILLLTQCQIAKVVISDFGLCKAIQMGHNSVSKTGIVGTEGWIAPEMINMNSQTCAMDIFSLGCVFYFVLTDGYHPFGESCRQDRINQGTFDLQRLKQVSQDRGMNVMAEDLIADMIRDDSAHRPLASAVSAHPLFWSKDQQLQFLMSVSDRIESKKLPKNEKTSKDEKIVTEELEMARRLEQNKSSVIGLSWFSKLSDLLQQDLRKFRSYKHHSVQDLLRAMRNKYHHYQELNQELKEQLGDIPYGYVTYFTNIFPRLLIHVYSAMTYCAKESIFQKYYPDDLCNFYARKFLEENNFETPRYKSTRVAKKIEVTNVAGGDFARILLSKSTREMHPKLATTPPCEESSSSNWRAKPPAAPSTADVVTLGEKTLLDSNETLTSKTTLALNDDVTDELNESTAAKNVVLENDNLEQDEKIDENSLLSQSITSKHSAKSKAKKRKKKKISKTPSSVLADVDENDSEEYDTVETTTPDQKFLEA